MLQEEAGNAEERKRDRDPVGNTGSPLDSQPSDSDFSLLESRCSRDCANGKCKGKEEGNTK